MLKVSTKTELLDLIHRDRKKLDDKLAGLTADEMVKPGMMDEWSAKDILGHLVDWDQRVMDWYQVGLQGQKPSMPAPGYTWRDLPALNRLAFEKKKDMPLEQMLAEYQLSYQAVCTLIESISEEDLFIPNRFCWTGTWCLAEYFAASTYKHYAWAMKNIRPARVRKEPTS